MDIPHTPPTGEARSNRGRREMNEATRRKRALLVNWDNYPNVASGGVYTWAKSLVESLSDWDFYVFNQVSNPNVNSEYTLPSNVKQVIELPIFGTNRYEEFYDDGNPFIPKIRRTTEKVVERDFLPLYTEFLDGVFADDCEPKRLGESICRLHTFLTRFDTKKCFENPLTWETFVGRVGKDPLYREMRLREALANFQTVERSMQVLSAVMPKVDIIHCSLAWLPAMVAIPAKVENGSPILITEHGVAFRELVLYYNAYLYNEPSRIFWTVFTRNMVRMIYDYADKITPVCKANKEWEVNLGVDRSKIEVVYNGIDIKKFRPIPVPKQERPTVVSVARLSIFKDIINLIQAIGYVRETVPTVQCLLYGNSTELEYATKCTDLAHRLGLEDNFKFMGSTKEPEKAYNMADVVAFSSISEGFPFGVIEAMACGKAIVATDVGGVSEAVEGCGLLVRSRRPRDLADGIMKLLDDTALRERFEKAAFMRATSEFSLERQVEQYRKIYDALTTPAPELRQPARSSAEVMARV
jgi:glycosyltransferase involved in cell wall biosynthesis